mmetsp:Transcript_4178/g.14730  ORF Transcript_4178/g.14730 Transcript_4178/m.14730 type:complete len:236 (-) Transcript_4178:32-739(-)
MTTTSGMLSFVSPSAFVAAPLSPLVAEQKQSSSHSSEGPGPSAGREEELRIILPCLFSLSSLLLFFWSSIKRRFCSSLAFFLASALILLFSALISRILFLCSSWSFSLLAFSRSKRYSNFPSVSSEHWKNLVISVWPFTLGSFASGIDFMNLVNFICSISSGLLFFFLLLFLFFGGAFFTAGAWELGESKAFSPAFFFFFFGGCTPVSPVVFTALSATALSDPGSAGLAFFTTAK